MQENEYSKFYCNIVLTFVLFKIPPKISILMTNVLSSNFIDLHSMISLNTPVADWAKASFQFFTNRKYESHNPAGLDSIDNIKMH